MTDRPSVYDAAGGAAGVLALADAWHHRVLADPVVGHPFERGVHPQHTERLAAYWGEVLGGPATYSATLGDETHVVRVHSGNGEHDEMNDRAVDCFDAALDDCGLVDEDLRAVLHDWFAWETRGPMYRYHRSADDVPDGLRIPRWSWDGLVDSGGESTR